MDKLNSPKIKDKGVWHYDWKHCRVTIVKSQKKEKFSWWKNQLASGITRYSSFSFFVDDLPNVTVYCLILYRYMISFGVMKEKNRWGWDNESTPQ